MGPRDRRARERAEMRESILNAARELFAEVGYDGVSMRKIAERIEYSPTAIYLHFADKETLFRELCYSDFRLLASEMAEHARIADPFERLRAIGEAYVRFGVTHPFHYRLMFMTPPPVNACSSEEKQKTHGNPELDSYAFLRQCVVQMMEQGWIRPELTDPDLVAQTLWATVHGVVSLEISVSKDPWIQWRALSQRMEAALMGIGCGLLNPERLAHLAGPPSFSQAATEE